MMMSDTDFWFARLSPTGCLLVTPVLKDSAQGPTTVLAATCYMLHLALQGLQQQGSSGQPPQPLPGGATTIAAALLRPRSWLAAAWQLGRWLPSFLQPRPSAITVRCVCV